MNPLLHQHHPSQAQPQPAHIRIYTCFKKKLMFFNYMFYMFSSCFNFLHRAMVAWLHLSKPCSSLRKNQDRFATHPTRICNLSASASLASRVAVARWANDGTGHRANTVTVSTALCALEIIATTTAVQPHRLSAPVGPVQQQYTWTLQSMKCSPTRCRYYCILN